MADKTLILISGMPATGKSTFAGWLAKRLRAPLVSYDRLLDQVCGIIEASGADPTAGVYLQHKNDRPAGGTNGATRR